MNDAELEPDQVMQEDVQQGWQDRQGDGGLADEAGRAVSPAPNGLAEFEVTLPVPESLAATVDVSSAHHLLACA
jgi:hypothetical protein